MNDHIKELYMAAVTAAGTQKQFAATNLDVAEKLVEMVVRECAAITEECGSAILPLAIKARFGITASLKIGSRVKVIAGFNVGAKGTVQYIEPTGRLWVRRDNAGSDVFYHPEEVVELQ